MTDVDVLYDRKLPKYRFLQLAGDVDLDFVVISLIGFPFVRLSDTETSPHTLILSVVFVLRIEPESVVKKLRWDPWPLRH